LSGLWGSLTLKEHPPPPDEASIAAVESIGRAAHVEPRPSRADATHDLYERYARQVFAFCVNQLGSRDEAEDAVQSTFLNAHRALQRGVTPEIELAWLFKIAHNVCLTRRRSTWRRGRVEAASDLQAMQDVIPAPHRESSEDLIRLTDALADMPDSQRRAILLREWQGLSYHEIAAELGLSQSAVETLIFRARRSLAANLEAAEPERRGLVARAKAALDLGTLLAALKTLFEGAAMKAAAAALAVSSAAVVATGSAPTTEESRARASSSPAVVSTPGDTPAAVVEPRAAVGVGRPVAPPGASAAKQVAVESVSASTAPADVAPESASAPADVTPAAVVAVPSRNEKAKEKVESPAGKPSAHLPQPRKPTKPAKPEPVAPPAAVVATPAGVAGPPADPGLPPIAAEQSAKADEPLVDLHERLRGDLEPNVVLVHVVDPAVEAAGRDDLLAALEPLDQLALALRSAALGPDDQDPEEDGEHDEREELHSLAFRCGCRGEPVERVRAVGGEPASLDRRPGVRGEVDQEPQIMKAEEAQPEQLLLVDEVTDVRAREALARRAGAALVQRAGIACEAGVPQVQPPLPGQRAPGARCARREHAIEHVDAAAHAGEQIERRADAHQVARLGLR
jgi:RNA polymerase sigma factor (sigma-70 family)